MKTTLPFIGNSTVEFHETDLELCEVQKYAQKYEAISAYLLPTSRDDMVLVNTTVYDNGVFCPRFISSRLSLTADIVPWAVEEIGKVVDLSEISDPEIEPISEVGIIQTVSRKNARAVIMGFVCDFDADSYSLTVNDDMPFRWLSFDEIEDMLPYYVKNNHTGPKIHLLELFIKNMTEPIPGT